MKTTTKVKPEASGILMRQASADDVPFIFNSWLKSYRESAAVRNITSTIYFTEHHKLIEGLLKTCRVFVACNSEEPDELYGYICAEKIDGIFVLHYVYVKHTYRTLGVAKNLLNQYEHTPETASLYTHHTKHAEKLAPKYRMVYSPYLAFMPEYRLKAQKEK